MKASKKLAAAGAAALLIYLAAAGGAADRIRTAVLRGIDSERMRNVTVVTDTAHKPVMAPSGTELPETSPTLSPTPDPTPTPEPPAPDDGILPTTITGGLSIKNETSYPVDIAAILMQGPDIVLRADEPQILIIHTHSSEAYTPAGLDRYEASDTCRTEDTDYNIVRIGDELTALLTEAGLNVIHDRGIYDYPSYTGSYSRSGAAVEQYLADYPSIGIVIDMHRDALGADGVVYKTMAEESGVCASQIMLLSGTDESGLPNPDWRSNLALALYLQEAVSLRHATLMRPVDLVPQRYNLHLTRGSLIMEVGSSGNTLQEALAAIRLFADAAAPALLELVE